MTGSKSINDNPISDVEDDRLGFAEMAEHIAASFLKNDLSYGFVIGVEGTWGSGKSSLVNLALKQLKPNQVVRFSPWLVGDREELLHQFFLDIGKATRELLPENIREKTRKLIKIYSALALGAAPMSRLLSTMGVPGTKIIQNAIELTASKAEELSSVSLGDLNLELRHDLKQLEHPIIIFIDDLDRLEPRELVEILRLVRAVADFPNVGYILAYDPENLASNLEKSISIEDGHAFLEKIVQASFRVPNAQSFDLRNWLSAEFGALLEGKELDLGKEHRVSSVLHGWAGRCLATPRDVVRTVNSLRFNFVPVRGRVDPGDALFLQLVRVKNDRLFQWIQRYVTLLSMFADGSEIPAGTGTRMGDELLEISGEKYDEDQLAFVDHLKEHLPGIKLSQSSKDIKLNVFSNLKRDDLQRYSLARRLASPWHSSLYFSFTHTAGHLSDEEIKLFLDQAVDDRDAAAAKFLEWAGRSRPQGRQMGEAALDRLVGLGRTITHEQVEGLFEVLGQTMDELARNSNPSTGYPDFLLGDRHGAFGLIELLPDERRMPTLLKLFKTAPSLTWLTGIVRFNTQINRGRTSVAEDAIFTEDELAVLSREFAARLARETPENLIETPYFLYLLYAWLRVEDKTWCLNWIKNTAWTEYGLLDVLEKMASWSSSADSGVQYQIQRQTLMDFFGSFEAPIERLKTISSDSKDTKLQQRANEVLSLIEEPK